MRNRLTAEGDFHVAKLTIAFAGVLMVLGFACFAMTGMEHKTSLIPAVVGIIMEPFGVLALVKPNLRMHAMHGAVTIGLLGFIAGIGGLIARRPQGLALFEMLALIVITGIYVAMCVNSFIQARRNRVVET
jgi:hypothetical protein